MDLAFLDGMIGLVALDATRNENASFYREAHAAFRRGREGFVAYQLEQEIWRMDFYGALALVEAVGFVSGRDERAGIITTADYYLEEAWLRLERIRQQGQTLMTVQNELFGSTPEAQLIKLAQKLEAYLPADGERREIWRSRRELLSAMNGEIKVLH